MRKFLLCFITLFVLKVASAQDFSNKGKEFWLAYSYHVGMVTGSNPTMTLSITSDVTTTYVVEIFGGATIATGTVAANTISYITVPNSYFVDDDGLFNGRAIHVTAAKPVVVYSFITRAQASAATLCLPATVLGKQYYSVNFTQISNENSSNSYITIVAVEDNTTIEVIPKVSTKGGWTAGSINTITLNKGQVYQVLGTTSGTTGVDLSGTSVRSIASALGSCKRIAVFSGSGKVMIGNGCTNGADNLYQQLYPTGTWGKNFLTVPSYQNPNNYYRIMLSTTTAIVKLNGAVIPAASFVNGYYTFFNNLRNKIESDEPICVSQYFTSQNCGGNTGTLYDPDMIVLNPVEQNISKVTLASINKLNNTNGQLHTVHVIIPNSGTALTSFKIDGVSPGDIWTPHPQNPNFSFAYFSNLTATSHTIQSDSGFNAIAYGYADFESYGYSAGTNVKDLYQQIGVASQYGIENTPSVCTGSPFKFKISLPYQADSMYWDLSPVHPGVWIKRIPPAELPYDSIRFVNGKQVWWYSVPTLYTYNTIGTYPITIKVYAPNADGCGNETEINFDLEVSDPPVADFNWVAPKCVADTVQFNDNSNTVKPTYKWVWNFGDPASGAANNVSALKNPKHKFSGPGTYTVTYSNITTPGCLSNVVTHTITIEPMPTASVASSVTSVCQNGTAPVVTFTGAGGTAPYIFSYTINGALPAQTITSTANTATVTVPVGTVGTIRYALTSVQNPGSLYCLQSQTGFKDVIIRPLPTATISGTASVCQTGTPPNVTFTGADATAPYTFTYTINGGAPQTVTTTTGNSVTVPVPTANTGTFIYNIVSVKDGTTDACTKNITTPSATVTIIPLPTAILTGSTTVCQNSNSPSITFTGNGGTAPYTFTYNIDGGTNLTVTSVGNTATLAVPTATVGTHVYTLTSVRDATANLCTQTISGQAVTIKVNALPSATVSGTTSVCQNATSPVITFTGSGTTAPYTFTYTVNGGAPQTITTVSGNSVTLPVSTAVATPLVYNLIKVNDGTTVACGKDITGQSATVTVRPLPTATIAGTTTVCNNSTSPVITFTGATGTAPYKFTYTINGGAPQTITTTGTNASVTVTAPTNTPGTFVYNLTDIIDASSNTCSSVITGQSATVIVKTLPTATIATNVTELCLNAAAPRITFTGLNGTPPYRFTYRINGNPVDLFATTTNSSSTVTVNVPTTTAGTYVYTLTNVSEGSSSACSQAFTGQSATVLVNPLPTANFTNSVPSCETRVITFNSGTSVANAGTITGWTWSFGDPGSGTANNSSVLPNPTHTFSAAGTYNVTLKVTTDKGCLSVVKSIPVTINARPKAGFATPEVCLLDPYAQFTDTSKIAAPATITNWEWDFGDAANSTGPNPNTSNLQNGRHHYTAVGSYTIRLIAISNNGCRDTTFRTMFVNGGNPVADFLPAATNNYCSNDTIAILDKSTITQGSITKIEIVWDNVNAPAVIETNETPVFDSIYKHEYPEFLSPLTKQYSIRVRAYSGGTCFSDKIRVVTINAAPQISFAPIPDGCIDVPAYQITQATEIGGLPGVGVYSGPGIIYVSPGVYNFSPAAAGPGTHKIKYVFTSSAGCVDSDSANVTVYPNPVVNVGPDVTILAGGSITLQPTVTGNDLRYLWSPAQYLNSAAIKNPLASPPVDFSYKLTVTARGGCIASDDLNVKVLMAPKIPNTFTPNNDGINDFWKIEYLDTYPNCRVQVFSRTGTLVFESRGYRKPWNGNMGSKSLPADTYYYIIEPESGRKPITGYVTIIK